MKIADGMEEKYRGWLLKRKNDPRGNLIINAVSRIGDALDNGEVAKALQLALESKKSQLTLQDRTQVALAISVLHERGGKFRFAWNRHYRGEDYALGIELTEKRLFDPT